MVKVDVSDVRDLFSDMGDLPDDLIHDAHQVFVSNTPKQSGNARRKTRLTRNRIIADYPYASVLDAGSSSQAPNGMSEPTIDFINQQVDRFVRKQ